MTMKKRIFLSNTAMVLISLLILFGIGGSSVVLFKDEFMKVIEQNAELPENIYQVETLLMENQENPMKWETLSSQLGDYQFELYVSDEKQEKQYSNVRHSEWECIEELEGEPFSSDEIHIYNMEGATIVKSRVSLADGPYYVYAAYYPDELSLWGMDRGMFEMFLIVFAISGFLAIAGLLLCCQLFTKSMIKRIMKPVDELNQAVLRINDGNLDEPISYDKEDEFGKVCHTFNEMQKHLKEGNEQKEKYEKARTEMVSGISHDLRTPLTSVKGYIKGMLDGVANTPEKKERYLKISYQKACDMEILLQKLFFFSKLETGNMPIFRKVTDLNSWLKSYVEQRQTESENHTWQLHFLPEKEPCFVDIDTEQMKRVFNNLIENSLKYANTEQIEIIMHLKKQEEKVHLLVQDNGKGVEEEKLPFIFDQFYRADEARNSKRDGSGLGLYVCKYIINEQDGEISAYNRNGLVIEIILPVVGQEGKE